MRCYTNTFPCVLWIIEHGYLRNYRYPYFNDDIRLGIYAWLFINKDLNMDMLS